MNKEGRINIDIILQYGDCILLQSKNGYLQSQGFTKPGLFLQLGVDDQLCFRNFRDFVFQVRPRLRYEAFKEHNAFKIKHMATVSQKKNNHDQGGKDAGAADELRMIQLTKKLEEELKENKNILERRIGEQVQYGQEIELVHFDSQGMLEASKTVAEFDKQSNLLKLVEQGSKSVCYYIEPRYKYRTIGQKVTYGDMVAFRNVKTDLYIHISQREVIWDENKKTIQDGTPFINVVSSKIDSRDPPIKYAPSYEVNCSSAKSKFTLLPFRNFEAQTNTSTIKGGQVIRLQHSETGAYVSSDDQDFTNDGLAEVFLWNYKGKSNDIESLTTNSLFELEVVQEEHTDSNQGQYAQYSGNISNPMSAMHGGMLFRLRHLNTGRLVVQQDFSFGGQTIKTVGLTEHYPHSVEVKHEEGKIDKVTLPINEFQRKEIKELNEQSLFRLVSTGVDLDNRIRCATSVQIQHASSKGFLILKNAKFLVTAEANAVPEEIKIDEKKIVKAKDEKLEITMSSQQLRKASIMEKQRTRKFVRESIKNVEEVNAIRQLESMQLQITTIGIQNNEQEDEEKLDTELFKAEDDANLNQGHREVLSFQKQPSFENAFFIYPESEESLKSVMYVHVSVNMINSFLTDISSPDLGTSKEQVKKIEKVLIELGEWLEEEKDFITPDDQILLDMPYSLEVNRIILGRKRRVQGKQRLVRELRVIESCVQILHIPFAKKAFDFKEITQESAITSICKLTYILLSKIVEDYSLNQIYAAQWINLYLRNVLDTGENNQIGADTFLTLLSDQNKSILENKFTTEIIEQFIISCQRCNETPRLLKLLTALCSCQNTPIESNQSDIVRILIETSQSIRNKFLMLLRRQRRGEIEICMDLEKGRYTNFLTLVTQITKLREDPSKMEQGVNKRLVQDYLSFLQLIDLLSEACLGRNDEVQRIVSENYEQKTIQSVLECPEYPFEIRFRFLKLYLNLYLDKNFQQLVVPSETVIWNQLHNLEVSDVELIEQISAGTLVYPFKTCKGHISRSFYRMKEFCEDYLVNQNGLMRLENYSLCQLTHQVLTVLLFMLKHGFYQDQADFNKIAAPIVNILDGSNNTVRVNGKDINLGVKRYFPNKEYDHSVQVKILACDCLIQIARLETDWKCSILLSKLKNDIENPQRVVKQPPNPKPKKKGGKVIPEEVVEEEEQLLSEQLMKNNCDLIQSLTTTKGFESQNENKYICVLFDLMLYRHPELAKRVFELLSIYFLRTRTVTTGLLNVQVLESSKSIYTLNQIKDYQNQLKQLQAESSFWLMKSNEFGNSRKADAMQIFMSCEKLCEMNYDSKGSPIRQATVKNKLTSMPTCEILPPSEEQKLKEDFILFDIDPVTPDTENQRLIYDFNIASIALYFIKQKVDRITINNQRYIDLISACYGFLVGYVRDNLTNQIQLYEDLDSIMRDSDKYQKATLLVYEIFKNNKKFLTLNVSKFLRQIVNYSEERLLDSPKKATYLKLLEVFCRYKDKLVRENQSEIILQFTVDTARSNVLYLLQPEGAKELYQPLSECQVVHHSETSKKLAMDKNKRDYSRQLSMHGSQDQHFDLGPGLVKINIQIFNMLQLIDLVTLCCEGFSEIAEQYSKQYILSFSVCGNMIVEARNCWPLKKAVLKYVFHVFMESNDPTFLQNVDEEESIIQEEEGAEPAESEVQTLLKIVENLNEDFERYLNDEIVDHVMQFPTGKTSSSIKIAEEYIFDVGMDFMMMTMQKKPSDIGSFDMKFFDIGKNLASLYYKAPKRRHKLKLFKLLAYIQTSENCARYLSDVKHPARKLKNNEELQKLEAESDEEESSKVKSFVGPTDLGSSKSSLMSIKVLELCNGEVIPHRKESEFEQMVNWVTMALDMIKKIMEKEGLTQNPYPNVRFEPIVSAILVLLDAQILQKEHQLMGIKLIRKIVEVENEDCITPAADWDSDDWTTYKRMIQVKQDYLVERGSIPFICKLLAESEDKEIREECILVGITLILGGNLTSQNNFIDYMVQEDQANQLLLTIKGMLSKYFELTKKYLTEKNAKLELVYKNKKQQEEKAQDDGTQEQDAKEGLLEIDEEGDEEDGENGGEAGETKNIISCIRVLRFIQLLCEGHHSGLQNHLREQKTKDGVRNPNCFDFVAYCSLMLGVYVKNYVNCYSTVLGNQLIEALVECVQGPCRANQKTLVDTKVIDCCRDLLSQGSGNQEEMAIRGFTGQRKSLLDQLKMNAVMLLLSIIEGTVDEQIYDKVSSSLGDFQIILQRMETLYFEFLSEELNLPTSSSLQRVQDSLKSDSFDGQISEGFDIYDLLNQLGDVIQRDRQRLQNFEKNISYSFFKRNTGKIEVNIDGDIQIVFFIIQPKCRFLTDITQTKFLQNVERETQQDKIFGLLMAVPSFIDEMDHLEEMTRRIIKLPPFIVFKIRDLSTILAVAIAFIIISNYKYEKVLQPDGAYDYMPYITPYNQFLIKIFGYIQLVSSSLLVLGFFINQKNLVIKEGWRKRVTANQMAYQGEVRSIQRMRESSMSNIKIQDIEVYQARQFLTIEGPYSSVFCDEDGKFYFYHNAVKFEYYWVSLSVLINNGAFIFSIQYLAFSLQGLLQSPVFYAFHLLDIIQRFPTLKDVIRSVTMNIKQLLMTAMLGVILIYLYGVIAFMFIPDLYFDEGIEMGLLNKAGDSICMSLLHCFLSTFNYGLRTGGGMGEFLPAETAAEFNSLAYNIRFFFDVSFFLLVITILLNVIFGIIIDTFAELREKSSMQSEDMKNVCYICGLNRQALDRDTDEGFEMHVNEDHEVWNYVYFLIHLQIKDKSDMNGVESYIKEKFEMQETSWFPLHRCLRIIKKQRKDSEHQNDNNKVGDLQKELHQKIQQAEEGIKNLETILS